MDTKIDTAAMAAMIEASQAGTPIPGSQPASNNGLPDNPMLAPPPDANAGDPNGTIDTSAAAPSAPAQSPAPSAGEGGSVAPFPPQQNPTAPSAPADPALTPPELAPWDPTLTQPGQRLIGSPDPAATTPEVTPNPPVSSSPETPTSATAGDPGEQQTGEDQFDPTLLYRLALGHDPSPEEVVQTIGIASRLSALDDDRQAFVNAVLNGQVDPNQLVAQMEELRRQVAAPPAPTLAPVVPQPGDPDYDPYAPQPQPTAPDPVMEAERQRLAQERAAIEAERARIAQHQQRLAQAGAQEAWSEFRNQHADWSREEIEALAIHANSSPLFGAIYESTGDAKKAMAQTINSVALEHEHFRNRLLASMQDPPPGRAQAAAALAGNGQSGAGAGAAGRGPTPPPRPPGADPALTQVGVPTGYAPPPAATVDPTQQQPVQAVASPLTPTAPNPTAGLDLTNRNVQSMAMAQEIARMLGTST